MTGTNAVTKINLKNGYVILKPFITRGAMKEYNKAIFNGVTAKAEEGVTPTIPLENLGEAQDILVKMMIEKCVINDLEVGEFDQQFIDNLDNADFKKIADACQKLITDSEVQKKSL